MCEANNIGALQSHVPRLTEHIYAHDRNASVRLCSIGQRVRTCRKYIRYGTTWYCLYYRTEYTLSLVVGSVCIPGCWPARSRNSQNGERHRQQNTSSLSALLHEAMMEFCRAVQSMVADFVYLRVCVPLFSSLSETSARKASIISVLDFNSTKASNE
jgi:hypothetical protein